MPRVQPEFTETQRIQVEFAAACGVKHENIAKALRIPLHQLRTHFADQLENGRTKLTLAVAGALVETALDRRHPSHAYAAIFILSRRGGWREELDSSEEPVDEVVIRVVRPEPPAALAAPTAD